MSYENSAEHRKGRTVEWSQWTLACLATTTEAEDYWTSQRGSSEE
jgi:hypothetical protein